MLLRHELCGRHLMSRSGNGIGSNFSFDNPSIVESKEHEDSRSHDYASFSASSKAEESLSLIETSQQERTGTAIQQLAVVIMACSTFLWKPFSELNVVSKKWLRCFRDAVLVLFLCFAVLLLSKSISFNDRSMAPKCKTACSSCPTASNTPSLERYLVQDGVRKKHSTKPLERFTTSDDVHLKTHGRRFGRTETEFMERMKRRMDFRRWQVKEACKLFGPEREPLFRISWSHQRHLAYCPIPKTGSSNWKRLLLVFNNYTNMEGALETPWSFVHEMGDGEYSTMTRSLPPEAANYTKLIIERHPFARLVSAYKDKVEDRHLENEFQIAYKKMRKYRHSANDDSNATASSVPTFAEFIDYVTGGFINELEGFGDEAMRHWAPYDRFCSPCSAHYDVIGKLETIQEDSRYVLNLINATDFDYPDGYNSLGGSTVQKNNYMEYFHDIEMDKIQRLYQIFRKDFMLFDYSLPFI